MNFDELLAEHLVEYVVTAGTLFASAFEGIAMAKTECIVI